MKKFLLVILFFTRFINSAHSQMMYEKYIGNPIFYQINWVGEAISFNDGSVISAFVTLDTNSFPVVQLVLLKTDSNGTTQWARHYQSGDIGDDIHMLRTSDEQILVMAMGSSGMLMMKCDTAGSVIW